MLEKRLAGFSFIIVPTNTFIEETEITSRDARWIGVFRHALRWSAFLKFVGKVLALATWIAFLATVLWWASSWID
jgi:hypothetical protein